MERQPPPPPPSQEEDEETTEEDEVEEGIVKVWIKKCDDNYVGSHGYLTLRIKNVGKMGKNSRSQFIRD